MTQGAQHHRTLHLTPINWSDYLNSGFDLAEDNPKLNRVKFINVFSLTGIIIVLALGVYDLALGNFISSGIEIAVSIAILVNQISLRWHKNINLAAQILIATITAPLMVLLLTDGGQTTGVLWFPMFPVVAYLLLGRRHGSTAMLILILTITLLVLVESFDLVNLAYSFATIRQIIVSLLILATLMYIHENLKEQSDKIKNEHTVQLALAYEKLEESERLRDEFLSILAHELRNGMVSIQKLTELWHRQHKKLDEEKQTEYITLINKTATDNLTFVNDLLDAASLESGNFELDITTNNLAEVIEQQANVYRPQASIKKITIETIYDQQLPKELEFDDFRIKQAINNLISNAIKHTNSASSIVIQVVTMKNYPDLQGKVIGESIQWYIPKTARHLEPLTNSVIVAVSHPESGIKTQDLSRLFNKFSQIQSKQTDKKHVSHGLGLYILKGIIESHGGTVGAYSTLAKGVTFYITLPVRNHAQ